MKLDLINREEDRQYIMENTSKNDLVDILKQYGEVVDYMTEKLVAEFYGVNEYTIKHIGDRHKYELEKYGYKLYRKSEIEKIQKSQLGGLEKIPNRGLRLYPIQAVIIIGMMLTESEVAERLRSDIIKKIFSPKEEFNLDTKELLKELRELRREVENLNSKINILSDNQNRNSNIETSKVNYKDENIIDDFNYSRFLNHINNLTDNTVLTKKEFLNLFNSYKFYHKQLGIMALNKFMNENNLIYGNDRLTDYAKENNILTRDTYKNHNKVFFTKNGILYISNLLINNMHGDYKIKRK